MPLGTFAFFTALGAGIWAAILAAVGFMLGRSSGDMTYFDLVMRGKEMATRHLPLVIGCALVAAVAYVLVKKAVAKRR